MDAVISPRLVDKLGERLTGVERVTQKEHLLENGRLARLFGGTWICGEEWLGTRRNQACR